MLSISPRPLSFARRQQYRRLRHAACAAIACTTAALLALAAASVGLVSIALVLLVVAFGFGLSAHHWLGLAGRSRIGVRSEDEVRNELARLEREGWRLRHSLAWRGRGDIDSVAIGPSGVAFVIETKTTSYDERQLALVRAQAAWLWGHRRRWCSRGAVAVLCVVRERGVGRWEQGAVVVSIDWLIPTLKDVASTT